MSVRAKILELLLDLKRDFGLTYVFITHDLATAKFVCNRIAILYLGKVVESGDASAVYAAPKHPYTGALLEAVPSPDPTGRYRPKRLPAGDVPDAVAPPAGCRFHPRCPQAFAPCGWEGRDLVAALEERWTQSDAFGTEVDLVGPLAGVGVRGNVVVFPRGGEDLAQLLRTLREEGAHRVFSAVEAIDVHGGGVEVRIGPGPEPALQLVDGARVACHLHGVTDADR
jgi:peptide/nickel transport system ATP-binding protein